MTTQDKHDAIEVLKALLSGKINMDTMLYDELMNKVSVREILTDYVTNERKDNG